MTRACAPIISLVPSRDAVAHFVMVAQRCGPEFLDNAKSFGRLLGRDTCTLMNREIFDKVRSIVQPGRDSRKECGIGPYEPSKHKG